MNAQSACPPPHVLSDFGLGRLEENRAETIGLHLETCDACRRYVAGLSGDGFVERLRRAHGPASAAESVSVSRSETPSLASSRVVAGSRPLVAPPELQNHPDYELLKELGHGGMGVVYLARNRMMDRLEVLKVVSKSLLDVPGALERFQQEIRSAAKLNHPNIVAAHSVLRPGDLLVFAMEYVEGNDLAETVRKRGPLPVTNASFYAHQTALGLQHAHEKGMVHRDIKPNNLMLAVVNKKHIVKILDFGLAKATSEKRVDGALTKAGQMLGTPDYIAPEQTLDAQAADIRADIYSLGCTLYFLLAGRSPFSGNSLYEILRSHHSVTATPLNELRPDVPAALAGVVAKMMAKRPDDRYQTPQEVAQALGPFFKAGAAPPLPAESPPSAPLMTPAIAPITAPPQLPPMLGAFPSFPAAPSPYAAEQQPPLLLRHPTPAWNPSPSYAPPSYVFSSNAPPSIVVPRTAGRRPPRNRGRKLAAAGAAGFFLLAALGIWVSVRDKDGNEIAKIQVPEGGKVKVETAPPSRSTPTNAAIPQAPASAKQPAPTALRMTNPNDTGFAPLFNGRDLTGWKQLGNGTPWRVLDGKLTCTGSSAQHLLYGADDFDDFHLRVETKISQGFGGISFRFQRDGSPSLTNGYHAVLKNTPPGQFTGGLLDLAYVRQPLVPLDTWFTLEIIAVQNCIRIFVNGTQTVDFTDRDSKWNRGAICLVKSSADAAIYFRKIELKRVNVTAPTPINHPAGTTISAPPPAVAPFDAKQARAHQEAWANHLGTTVETTNSIGMKMVLIPPGSCRLREFGDRQKTFTMQVEAPFRIGIYEVTQAQYKEVMGVNPSRFVESGEDAPVEQVGWNEAVEFCQRLSELRSEKDADHVYRLPYPKEWNCAAQAGSDECFSFGADEKQLDDYAWFKDNSGGRTHPVGAKLPNNWGLFDVHGNVEEWSAKTWGESVSVSIGSWNHPSRDCVTGMPYTIKRTLKTVHRGFRVVCEISEATSLTTASASGVTVLPMQPKPPTKVTLPSATALGHHLPSLAVAPFDPRQARGYQETWAKHLGTTVETSNSLGMKMVLIPPGEFQMGSTDEQIEQALELPKTLGATFTLSAKGYENEKPQHLATLAAPYSLGATEITVGQFGEFVNSTKYVTECEQSGGGSRYDSAVKKFVQDPAIYWRSPGYSVVDATAVSYVTWNDAVAFCNWLSAKEKLTSAYTRGAEKTWKPVIGAEGYRLPTEAEWEFACRAGTVTQFSFGDDLRQFPNYGWAQINSGQRAHEVGEKLPNAFGVYDMHGNVAEYCQDVWALYTDGNQFNPLGSQSGQVHTQRGGDWYFAAHFNRSAARKPDVAKARQFDDSIKGFRVARTLVEAAVMPASNSTQSAAVVTVSPPQKPSGQGRAAIATPAPTVPAPPIPSATVRPSGSDGKRTLATPPIGVVPFNATQARLLQQAWAKYLGATVEVKNSKGMQFVLIPPCTFKIGFESLVPNPIVTQSPTATPVYPPTPVTVDRPFFIGMTELTVGQFRQFVEATQYQTDAERIESGQNVPSTTMPPDWKGLTWKSPGSPITEDHPVQWINHNDVAVFCNWLSNLEGLTDAYRKVDNNWDVVDEATGYRLPHSEEWECAARGGTATEYFFVDKGLSSRFDWPSGTLDKHPVAQKLPNPYGLFDLYGNISEQTERHYLPPTIVKPYRWRVARGGSSSLYAGGTHRVESLPGGYISGAIGFRLLRPAVMPAANTSP